MGVDCRLSLVHPKAAIAAARLNPGWRHEA